MSAAPPTLSSSEELFRPGTRLGDGDRYALQSVIAVGGMATVYRAWDERLGDECAIKAFYSEIVVPDSPGEKEFHAEALLLARLRYPGIVAVRDHFFARGYAFLVMDFVPGENLYDRHRRTARPDEDPDDLPLSPIPESQVAAYGIALAETLSYLHKLSPPVIYRDLKPHNIICRAGDRRLILLDFGIARLFKPVEGACDTQAMGTPGYAAPEQYDGQIQSDPRTDLYSLGVVLYELATGYNPRAEGASRKLPWPQEIRATLTAGLSTILARCTAWERDGRYPSAEALIEDLKDMDRAGSGHKQVAQPLVTEPAWRFSVDEPIMATPAVSEGTLFVADCRGGAYALEIASGHLRWRYQVPQSNSQNTAEQASVVRTALAVSPDGSFMALSFPCGEGMLGASLLDARTGTHRSIIKAPLARQIYPAIIAHDQGGKAQHDLILALGCPDEIVSISLANRTIRWRIPLASAPTWLVPIGQIAGEQAVLVGDSKGYAQAVRVSNGALLWKRQICHGPLVAPPLIAPEVAVLGGAPGDPSLSRVNLATGEVRWQTQIAGQLVGAPLAVKETLIVPSRNAGLFGIDFTSGEVLWHQTSFSRPLVGAAPIGEGDLFAIGEYGEGARILIARASEQLSIVWQAPLPSGGTMVPPLQHDRILLTVGVAGALCAWNLSEAR
jgi:serine/threonine protein kinase